MNTHTLISISIFCILPLFAGRTSRVDKVADITSETQGSGSWLDPKYCKYGEYAKGFQLRSDYNKPHNDKRGITDFKLVCTDDNTVVSSTKSEKGEWLSSSSECTQSNNGLNTLKGFKTKDDDNSGDLKGLVNIKGRCDDNESPSNDLQYSMTWPTEYDNCPAGSNVCGYKAKYMSYQVTGTDYKGVTGIKLYCCTRDIVQSTESKSANCNLDSVKFGDTKTCSISLDTDNDNTNKFSTLQIAATFTMTDSTNSICIDPQFKLVYKDNHVLQEIDNDYINIYQGTTTTQSNKISIDGECIGSHKGSRLDECLKSSCTGTFKSKEFRSSTITATIQVPKGFTNGYSSACNNGKKIDGILYVTCKKGHQPIINSLPDTYSHPENQTTGASFSSTKTPRSNCLICIPKMDSSTGWCSTNNGNNREDENIQVDLGAVYSISRVGTKGFGDGFTTTYKLMTSLDGVEWSEVGINNPLTGNTNLNTEVINAFDNDIIAQYLQYIPVTYSGNYKALQIEAYGELMNNYVSPQDIIGSISVDSSGNVQSTNNHVNSADLICAADDDKILWGGLLTMNQAMLSKLTGLRSLSQVTQVQEYIQCSEIVYATVTNAAIPAPFRLLDAINAILKELSNIPTVGSAVKDAADDISQTIITILNTMTPNELGINWASEYNEDGTIFNPMEKIKQFAKMLSNIVCDEMIGSDIETILLSIKDSTEMNDIINTFDTNIKNELNSDATTSLLKLMKTELETDDKYKRFVVGVEIGVRIQISKGISGSIERSHGIYRNLNNNYKIFESRFLGVTLPTYSIGIGAESFFRFIFAPEISEAITELTLDVGIAAQIPGSDKTAAFIDQWNKHSDKLKALGDIPFINDGGDIGKSVNWINGQMDSNPILMDIMTGGANSRLSFKYDMSTDILNCRAITLDLSVGDGIGWGLSVFTNVGYTKQNTGNIDYGTEWIYDIDKSNFKQLKNIIFDINPNALNIFNSATNKIVNKVTDLGTQISDKTVSETVSIVNGIINKVENVANDIINDANTDVIAPVNTIIGDINTAVGTVKDKIEGTTGSVLSKFNAVVNDISAAKSVCRGFNWGGFLSSTLNDNCKKIFDKAMGSVTAVTNKIDEAIDNLVPTVPLVPNVPTVEIGNVRRRRRMLINNNIFDTSVNTNLMSIICYVVVAVIIFVCGFLFGQIKLIIMKREKEMYDSNNNNIGQRIETV